MKGTGFTTIFAKYMHLQVERFYNHFVSGMTTTFIALKQQAVLSFTKQWESSADA